MLYYCLVEALILDNRCSRDDGVRASRGSPCGILLLWFSTAALPPKPTRPAHSHLLSLMLKPNRFPLSPVPKNEILFEACGADLKHKRSRSGIVLIDGIKCMNGAGDATW